MNLREKAIEVLKDINFIERYKKLSEDFERDIPLDERFENIDRDVVKEILYKFGEKVTYNKSEKFFKVRVSKIDDYTFNNNIALNCGRVELIWIVKGKEESMGPPLIALVREVLKENVAIKRPLFETYEELEEILRINFEMFDDFIKALLKKND